MGRMQDPSDLIVKMSGKQRSQSDAPTSNKRRKTGRENEGSKEPNDLGEPTPGKDRRAWTHEEEMNLVKVLLEHAREGRTLPLQSKSATYWADLIKLVYPGEKGITQRRLYDKVRRMQQRYNEILLQERDTVWKTTHEKTLFDFWRRIFPKEMHMNKTAMHEAGTRILQSVLNGNPVKVAEVSDSSEEEEEDDDEEERVPILGKVTRRGTPPTRDSSSSEEKDEEDEDEDEGDEGDRSPGKRRHVTFCQHGSRAEASRFAQEEIKNTASFLRDDHPKSASELGCKQSRGSEKEKLARKEQSLYDVDSGEKRSTGVADQPQLDAAMVRSLRDEVFEYLNNLRNDYMRELEEVKRQLINPTQLQLTKRCQDLILEELSLREKELEMSRLFCRLHKEAVKLRKAS